MSSSEPACDQSLLAEVLDALDPDRLRQEVSGPMQAALETFRRPRGQPVGQGEFLEVVGDFLQHFYRHGLVASVQLSSQEAKALALELLEVGYQGSLASGYVGALLEATSPQASGLGAVLLALVEILARREMGRLAAAALVRLVNPADWHRQRQLVEELVSHLGPSFPQHLVDRPLDSLVPAYRELLALFRDAQGFLASPGGATEIAGPFPPLCG